MKFDKIAGLDDERFLRLTGVKRTTFDKMVFILREADKAKKIRGGRKNKLNIECWLVVCLLHQSPFRVHANM